jgi:hypothetical protein
MILILGLQLMTIIRNNRYQQQQKLRSLIICGGKTEFDFLYKCLDSKKIKLQNEKNSNNGNAFRMITKALNNKISYDKIYFVFDRDHGNNTQEQFAEINKLLNQNNHCRVCSSPCFEVALLFNYNSKDKQLSSCSEVEKELEKLLNEPYCKSKINNYKFNFMEICENARKHYNNSNIANIINKSIPQSQIYSEIFHLQEFANEIQI